VHRQELTRGAGLWHEHATALAQGTINGLDDACATCAFGAAAVPAGRYVHIGGKQVGEVLAVPPVTAGPAGGVRWPRRGPAP
jgi:hypothetical protein